MSYQAAFDTLHNRCDSRLLRSLKAATCQLHLMTRLVVDTLLVNFRESCPQLDDLGHLQVHQVNSEILDLVPSGDPIRSNHCSLINQLIISNICEIKCH